MPGDSSSAPTVDQRQERAEVEAVLASEMFRRAPTLRQILAYVCQQYFLGEAARIKEYNIAVEALGRSPDFDPTDDTIVRVEASRLRKRLTEYYATEGSSHTIQIQLAKSGYVPQFVPRPSTEEAAAPADGSIVSPEQGEQPPPGRGSSRTASFRRPAIRIALMSVGGILLLGVILSSIRFYASRRSEPATRAPGENRINSTSASPPSNPSLPPGREIRILAGYTRPQFVDGVGQLWSGDRYFTGGTASESAVPEVAGVLDPVIYRTVRRGSFRYDIPLPPGIYELRLLFVETYYRNVNRVYTGESSRVFHVDINGVRRLSSFDILSDAGAPDVPADRVFKDISPDKDGFLHLVFTPVSGNAVLNGIEILPGTRGKLRPVRIVAGGRSYYDRAGRFWGADRYFVGGRPLTKPTLVTGTSDPELYSSERWGHFQYSVPVAEGHYKVTLKFAETNFGPSNPGRTGIGSRVFDVYCNGVALLRNFDILKEAGGENRALDKVFSGLSPNAQGRLLFSFVPVTEYPTVRAIEVLAEGQ
jgi:hypothetical protein